MTSLPTKEIAKPVRKKGEFPHENDRLLEMSSATVPHFLRVNEPGLQRGGKRPARAISSHAGSNSTRDPTRCHTKYLKLTKYFPPKISIEGYNTLTPPPAIRTHLLELVPYEMNRR